MASFFGNREEDHHLNSQIQLQDQQQVQPQSSAPSSSAAAAAHPKKKRNLPGNPNPDAEVIALSPKSLLATNRFICEVCNKGFQREQNLQLHRRGHNLPWKLKQKSTKEVRRKVYLCPETTCVHHDPSRALGDLTGIKKHFCRKHGEKKWKCDKCSKKYAVQSDWKAHSKTCGTREYRCDCGTLFSRRDSFITHRAFCDALAQESVRLSTDLSTVNSIFTNNNNMSTVGLVNSQVNSQLSSLQDHQGPSFANALALSQLTIPNPNSSFQSPSSAFYLPSGSNPGFQEEDPTKPFHHGNNLLQLPNLQNSFNLSFFSNTAGSSSTITNSGNTNTTPNAASFLINSDQFNNSSNASASADSMSLFAGVSSFYNHNNAPAHNEQMLPQMSATALLQKAAQMGATSSGGFASISTTTMSSEMENDANLQDLMNSLANGNTGIFGGSIRGGNEVATGFGRFNANPNLSIGAGSDGLTRDFLGVGSVVRGLGGGLTQREQHQMGSLDSGSPSGRPFGM